MPLPAPQTPPQRPISDDDARRLCAALAPLQALSAALRSAPLDASGGGASASDPHARPVAQAESGAIAAARLVHERILRVRGEAQGVLLDVATVAHNDPSLRALALHVARARHGANAATLTAQVEQAATDAEDDANTAKGNAAKVLRISPLSKLSLALRAERDVAIGRRESAAARVAAAEAAVAEHGMRLLRAAVDAWERTEEE